MVSPLEMTGAIVAECCDCGLELDRRHVRVHPLVSGYLCEWCVAEIREGRREKQR